MIKNSSEPYGWSSWILYEEGKEGENDTSLLVEL
jgi:hypothetical protein